MLQELHHQLSPQKTNKMEKIDENMLAQINEEANIIYENIKKAIPDNSSALSVVIAVEKMLKSITKYINERFPEVKMRSLVLDMLEVIMDDEESAQSQI